MFVKTVNLYIITLWITLFFSLIFVCHFSWACSILEIRACEVHQTGFRACINLAFSVADIDFVDEEKMAHDLIFCQAPSLRRSIDLLFERNMTFFPYFFLTVWIDGKEKVLNQHIFKFLDLSKQFRSFSWRNHEIHSSGEFPAPLPWPNKLNLPTSRQTPLKEAL